MIGRILFLLACAVRLAAWQARLALHPPAGTHLVQSAQSSGASPTDRGEAVRLGRVVNAVAARMPWRITCLARSVVLVEELQRRGMAASLRIGARLGPTGELDAHAWAEVGGQPVNDRADVASEYPPLQPAARARIRHWS